MAQVCPVITPSIQEVFSEIQRLYPEASVQENLDTIKTAEWVGLYCNANSKSVDSISKKDARAIVNYIEKLRNLDNKSFLTIKTVTPTLEAAMEGGSVNVSQMNRRELWNYLESIVEPMGERPVSYTPVGKTRQQYIIKNGKVYNKKGEEVHYQGKDMNRILANLAIAEDRGVVVTYRDADYVVDNHQTITSVTSGDIMKWGLQDGNRKAIIQLAEQKFKTLIENRQNRLSEMVPELMDLLKVQGINIHDKADMEKFLKENPQWSTKIQPIIVGNSEKNSNFAAKSNNNKDERREILSERFTQEELRACTGILEETEALLQGRDESSVPETKTEKTGDVELGKRQESILENWAKENNLWIENTTETLSKQYGEPFAEEGEATVYSKDGNTVVKAISLAYYIEPHLMLDRIVLHNRVAPDTALTLTHFGRNEDGEFVVVAEQPFVEGERPTQDEIVKFMASLGFKPYNKRNTDFINEEAGIIADDIHDENVIKTSNNAFLIIDGDFRINTANYNLNGTRTTKGNRNIQAYTTPQGEIYGFADNKGDLYFDEEKVSPNVQIHEYTHLWDRAIAQRNPKLWKHGVDLMKQTSLWDEVLNDVNYGQKWQAMKGMTPEKMESLIASEVHSRLTGTQGEALLNRIAKEKGHKGIVAKLKQWMLDFWKELKGTFSNWSDEEINNLTIDDFNKMTVRDLVDKVNLKERQDTKQPVQQQAAVPEGSPSGSSPVLEQFKKDIDLLSGYYEGGGRALEDDLPNITQELDDKLNNYFMGGEELSIDDYRKLWQLIEFYNDNGRRMFRPRKPSSSSSPSNAATVSPLAKGMVSFDPVEAKSESDRLKQQQGTKTQPETFVDNNQKFEEPKSQALESALNVKDSRMAQFRRLFSPQQIKDRGAMISSIFSRILDDLVEDEIVSLLVVVESDTASEAEKNEAKQRINDLRDPVIGRQLAAQKRGISDIMDSVKEEIEWSLENAEEYGSEEDKVILWQNTLEYFPELFNTQATLDIEAREGIRIVGLDIVDKTASEEENDAQDDGDDEVGHIASGSDGWSYQVRYTNPFDSLSRKVRGMLYEIERPESQKDDLGQTRNYPMGQIYASLLSYLARNMQNPDDFIQIDKSFEGQDRWGNDITESTYPNGYPTFPVLEDMKKIYPWVQQIIDRLTDDYIRPDWNTNLRYPSTGGSMASQFYTNFRKAFIPYGKIQLGKGKFDVTPLNYQMEDRVQYDKLVANYNNRMILSSHSIYNADGKVNKENAEWLKKQLEKAVADMRNNERFQDIPELMEYHQTHPEEGVLSEEYIQEYNDFLDNAMMLLQSFGIDTTLDSVTSYLMMDEGGGLESILVDLEWVATVISKVDDSKIDSFNYIVDTNDRYGTNLWKHFFDNRGLITDASYMQSFYDSASKKTKYSYSADNYLMKTFRGVCMGTLEQRRAFIDEHFGKYEWFRNQKTGEWRNKWLDYWYNYPDEVKELPYRNVDNVTVYSGGNDLMGEESSVTIRQYSKWEPSDIWQVQNRSYAPDKESKHAFYLAPIFSDSPMSMTVKGPKMSMEELLYGYNDEQGHHQGAILALVNQELYRIGYVQRRAQAIAEGRVKAIANFDGNRGQQFCFIPELNNYVFEATDKYPRQSFLERMLSMKEDRVTLAELEAAQIQAIQEAMGNKMEEYYLENQDMYDNDHPLTPEQYYNMVYANAAIIQLTTVDLAYYKDDIEFQKRFKEVYAGGIQLNTNSKYGTKTENIILLSDDIITSPSYDKVAACIDGSDTLSKEDKERIKETFKGINVADAQAIRAMHSFRSVLDMMGNWTDAMETALNHFKEGNWQREDFDIIYQTIKPFVYSVIERNDGEGGSILVPQQNKNSEICALMMYDLITNGLEESPVYKALSEFMETRLGSDGKPLIHMAQFESAGKVGNQGVINISFNPTKIVNFIEDGMEVNGHTYKVTPAYIVRNGKIEYIPNTVDDSITNYYGKGKYKGEKIKGSVKEQLDKMLTEGKIPQEDYNKIISSLRPTKEEIISILDQKVLLTDALGNKTINSEVVHTISMDNYYQQQPTPAHHIDAEATFGSQARNISVADLPDNFELTVTGKGSKKHIFKGKDAIIDFYYELLNENLIEDFFGKRGKGGLKGVFADKKAFRDAVTEIVRGNPKYGRDFADALQLDDKDNFLLNPNSPTVFNMMQEIVTSFFKNRITKQTINGAALIQAAGIGLDDSLRLEFDDNNRCIGAHCLMPLTSKKFFEPLLDTQMINGKEVKVLNPEKLKKAGLDKAIGYRIPTENKSSMLPLIIDGFTPLQNGSAIVLPAEITNIAGSDFDVDKMFIMLLSFNLITHDKKKAFNDYTREEPEAAQEIINALGKANIEDLEIEEIGKNFAEWFEEHKDEYLLEQTIVKKIEYDFNISPKENGRKARNNMLIQMIYGILTSKEGSESVLNPQGFPDVEHAAKFVRILTDKRLRTQLEINTNPANASVLPPADQIISTFLELLQEKYPEQYEEYKEQVMKMSPTQIQEAYLQAVTAGNKGNMIKLLMNSSTDDLIDFIKKYSAPESPIYPQTFAHSHARNMAGMNQIGIYAIQASMCAKYQRANVRLRDEQQFTINGRTISNVDVSDGGRRLKNVGQPVGASADNGKNPNLSDMGSTTKTAPIIGYMLRTGLSHLEAALIINQPHMKNAKFKAQKGWKKGGYFGGILGKNPLATPVGNVTTNMLIRRIISPFEVTAEEDKAIAGLCYRILLQSEAQEYLTKISRADSPNGSIQNTYAKARIQRFNVDLFQAKMGQDDFPFIRIQEALSNTAVDTSASEDVIREQLKNQRMGFLHGMYALGINSFNNLVSPYFFGAQPWFDDDIVKPILYNLKESLSDEKKEEIINNIYTSYITFMLSSSPLFGNEEGASMKSKRNYYLNSFPDDYQKIIQENEDIRELLKNVLQVSQTSIGARKRIILKDVGSLGKEQKLDVQGRLESLIYSDNPVARKLAGQLLVYSYFDNGLQFTHDSFSHLFTTKYLTSFPAYTDTLNRINEEIPVEEKKNFIEQFLLTYPNVAFNVTGILKGDKGYTISDSFISIDLNDKQMRRYMINEVMSPNPHSEGINVYPYIQYEGDIYVLDKEYFDSFPNSPTYIKLPKYTTYPKLPLFSTQMSVEEMAQEFPVGSVSNNNQLGEEYPSIDNIDAPMAPNEGSGDPNVAPPSMYEAAEAMDEYEVPDIDMMIVTPRTLSDTYQSEGEGELQTPFCP